MHPEEIDVTNYKQNKNTLVQSSYNGDEKASLLPSLSRAQHVMNATNDKTGTVIHTGGGPSEALIEGPAVSSANDIKRDYNDGNTSVIGTSLRSRRRGVSQNMNQVGMSM